MDEVSTATIRHRGRCVVSIVRQIDESCLTQTVAANRLSTTAPAPAGAACLRDIRAWVCAAALFRLAELKGLTEAAATAWRDPQPVPRRPCDPVLRVERSVVPSGARGSVHAVDNLLQIVTGVPALLPVLGAGAGRRAARVAAAELRCGGGPGRGPRQADCRKDLMNATLSWLDLDSGTLLRPGRPRAASPAPPPCSPRSSSSRTRSPPSASPPRRC